MHRTVRTTMLAFAAVSLVGGPAYSLAVAPRLARLPVEVHQRQVAEGSGVYLDPDRRFRVFGPARLRNVHEVRGVIGASSSSVAVWTTHDQSFDLDRERKVEDFSDRYALDRRSARAVSCCGADPGRRGSLSQAFPLGTRRTSYPWWDGTAERSYVARFVGGASLRGVSLYRFRVTVAPIVIDRVDLPPEALHRSDASSIALDWWYKSQTDLLVEPASGVIVKGSQVADQWLANRAGARRLTVATTSLVDTPRTIERNLRAASDLRASLIAKRVWPVVLGPLLAMALLAAAVVRSELSPRT